MIEENTTTKLIRTLQWNHAYLFQKIYLSNIKFSIDRSYEIYKIKRKRLLNTTTHTMTMQSCQPLCLDFVEKKEHDNIIKICQIPNSRGSMYISCKDNGIGENNK
jgi:hypothetical protein